MLFFDSFRFVSFLIFVDEMLGLKDLNCGVISHINWIVQIDEEIMKILLLIKDCLSFILRHRNSLACREAVPIFFLMSAILSYSGDSHTQPFLIVFLFSGAEAGWRVFWSTGQYNFFATKECFTVNCMHLCTRLYQMPSILYKYIYFSRPGYNIQGKWYQIWSQTERNRKKIFKMEFALFLKCDQVSNFSHSMIDTNISNQGSHRFVMNKIQHFLRTF